MKASKQVGDTLNSIDNLRRAEANTYLYQKVMQRVNSAPAKIRSIKPSLAWSVAASLVLLVGINVFTCANYAKSSNYTKITISPAVTVNPLVSDYFSTNNIPQF